MNPSRFSIPAVFAAIVDPVRGVGAEPAGAWGEAAQASVNASAINESGVEYPDIGRGLRTAIIPPRTRLAQVRARSWFTTPEAPSVVLVRSRNPEERLDVDHVARPQVAQIAGDGAREIEKMRVRLP